VNVDVGKNMKTVLILNVKNVIMDVRKKMISTGNETRDVNYAISTYINFAAVSITKELELQKRLITCTNQAYIKDILLEIKQLKMQRKEADEVINRLLVLLDRLKKNE